MAEIIIDEAKIHELLTKTVEEVIDLEHLKNRLYRGDRLRIKFGIDPTANILHLGHSIPLRKLKQFQNLGHQVIFLIGDFTAKIGDPSGRSASRPSLTDKEIRENMKNYVKLAAKILDIKKIEIRYNSEWFVKEKADFMMKFLSMFTYGQLKAREEFKQRIKKGIDITLEEMTYPLLQGYDSVALKADIEIGGTDQKFNLLMGRKVQKKFNLPGQDIMTLSLLEGIDGERKMSKSYGNFIALNESPSQMYAKIMSIPDTLIWRYMDLLTDIPSGTIEELRKSVGSVERKNAKHRLSHEVTFIYHGSKEAEFAAEEFNRVFREKNAPQEIKEIKFNKNEAGIIEILMKSGLISSVSEAKRLVSQGAVEVNNQKISGWDTMVEIKGGVIIKIGPRRFFKAVE